jgi:hypothetical protein
MELSGLQFVLNYCRPGNRLDNIRLYENIPYEYFKINVPLTFYCSYCYEEKPWELYYRAHTDCLRPSCKDCVEKYKIAQCILCNKTISLDSSDPRISQHLRTKGHRQRLRISSCIKTSYFYKILY